MSFTGCVAGTDGGAIASVVSSSTLALNDTLVVADAVFSDTVAAGGNGGMVYWQAVDGATLSLRLRDGWTSSGAAVGGGGGGLFMDLLSPSRGGALTVGAATIDLRDLNVTAPVWAASFGASSALFGRCVLLDRGTRLLNCIVGCVARIFVHTPLCP